MTYPHPISKALLQSLTQGPLLITDLPEATAFSYKTLAPPSHPTPLNLQQKLGYLYEDALQVILTSTPTYQLLARGIQIRETAGHTLGELDFLIKNLKTQQTIHLELAVKFYLAVETGNQFLLPGPDARDNYYRKLEKMRTHQLILLEKYPHLLPEEFQKQEILTQQLVYGCIFDHINAQNPVNVEYLSPTARRGKWLHAEECPAYFGENTPLEEIPKPLWPVPLETLKNTHLEKWTPNQAMDRCTMVRANNSTHPYFIAPNRYKDRVLKDHLAATS